MKTPRMQAAPARDANENRDPAIRRLLQVLPMQERRARQILQALIQGVDPFDGKELPSGTVLQQADVLRAMLAGVAAMEQDAVRASRRAQLPRNIGRSWTDDENMKLVMKKYPHTKWADLAAYNMIDNKLCGSWKGETHCPEKESELYEKYAREHPGVSAATVRRYLASIPNAEED